MQRPFPMLMSFSNRPQMIYLHSLLIITVRIPRDRACGSLIVALGDVFTAFHSDSSLPLDVGPRSFLMKNDNSNTQCKLEN